jgi:hypothetical protein
MSSSPTKAKDDPTYFTSEVQISISTLTVANCAGTYNLCETSGCSNPSQTLYIRTIDGGSRNRITSDEELVPDNASTSWRELDEYVSVVLNVGLVAKIKI